MMITKLIEKSMRTREDDKSHFSLAQNFIFMKEKKFRERNFHLK